jgi:hypothetical protein
MTALGDQFLADIRRAPAVGDECWFRGLLTPTLHPMTIEGVGIVPGGRITVMLRHAGGEIRFIPQWLPVDDGSPGIAFPKSNPEG